jgi:hypothetical protein
LSSLEPVPVAASAMSLVAVMLAFLEGGDLTGTLHFNGVFMIPFLWHITHHIVQKCEAISASRLGYLFNKHLFTSSVVCRKITCTQKTELSRYHGFQT